MRECIVCNELKCSDSKACYEAAERWGLFNSEWLWLIERLVLAQKNGESQDSITRIQNLLKVTPQFQSS